MSATLSIEDIVWAKVEPYPWWPGKIIQHRTQLNTHIYKISFFNDPTYTYLHPHQLVPFESFDSRRNQVYPQNKQLIKAIQIATRVFQRTNKKELSQTQRNLAENEDQNGNMSLQQNNQQKFQPNIQKKSIDHISKTSSIQKEASEVQEQKIQNTISFSADQITHQNVIQLLQQSERSWRKLHYCYELRKEEIRLRDRLKDMLLDKYNLLSLQRKKIHLEGENQKIGMQIQTVCPLVLRKNKKIKKLEKNKSICRNQHIHQLEHFAPKCIAKVFSLLKRSDSSISIAKQQSIFLIRRITALSEGSHLKLKSLTLTLLKSLMRTPLHLNCRQRTQQFIQYLQRLQNEKNFDEQGSKMTQISVPII